MSPCKVAATALSTALAILAILAEPTQAETAIGAPRHGEAPHAGARRASVSFPGPFVNNRCVTPIRTTAPATFPVPGRPGYVYEGFRFTVRAGGQQRLVLPVIYDDSAANSNAGFVGAGFIYAGGIEAVYIDFGRVDLAVRALTVRFWIDTGDGPIVADRCDNFPTFAGLGSRS